MALTLALLWIRLNPFDAKTILFARHAQHVVLIHFPIALFVTAVAFDVAAHWTKRPVFADAAYYNLSVAAFSIPAVVATGILAWQFQLEGQRIKGILLLHLVLACAASGLIWLAWWIQFRMRRRMPASPAYRFAIEIPAVCVIVLTAHLGGFLSGVNRPG